MDHRELAVSGCVVFEPAVHADDRGHFVELFRQDALEMAVGRGLELRQGNASVSARGVLRGVHFAVSPRGQAKYVTVLRGSALDFVIDLRVGSPTFGAVDSVQLDAVSHRSVWIPEGVGHAFLALEDLTTLSYMVTDVYRPEHERILNPLDPTIGLELPIPVSEIVLSDRDRHAPALAQLEREGGLPSMRRAAGTATDAGARS